MSSPVDVDAPVYVADHDQWQDWNRRVAEACFQAGFELMGFVHMVSSTAVRDVCPECGCGPVKHEPCWYCPTVEEKAA